MTLCVRYNPLPGKTEACDRWVQEKLVPFFCRHEECKGVEVMEDILIGDPERTVLVRLSDVCSATSILESEEAKAIKREFMEYACDFSSQILNTVSKKTA